MTVYVLRREYDCYDSRLSDNEFIQEMVDNLGVFSSLEKAKEHAQDTTKDVLEWIDRDTDSYTRAIPGTRRCYIIEQFTLDEGWFI